MSRPVDRRGGLRRAAARVGTSALPCPTVTRTAAKSARGANAPGGVQGAPPIEIGAGNGIRTRDFDLGKVALYH